MCKVDRKMRLFAGKNLFAEKNVVPFSPWRQNLCCFAWMWATAAVCFPVHDNTALRDGTAHWRGNVTTAVRCHFLRLARRDFLRFGEIFTKNTQTLLPPCLGDFNLFDAGNTVCQACVIAVSVFLWEIQFRFCSSLCPRRLSTHGLWAKPPDPTT